LGLRRITPAERSALLPVVVFLAFKERDQFLLDVKISCLEAIALENLADPGLYFARFANGGKKAI
jgi:hypothetical protein